MHRTDKYSQHSSIIWPVWLNGWVFVYELSGCGFESRCSHLIFRYGACFEQGVPWHSGNCGVWIHSQTRTWHDKKHTLHHLVDLNLVKKNFVGYGGKKCHELLDYFLLMKKAKHLWFSKKIGFEPKNGFLWKTNVYLENFSKMGGIVLK